MLDANSIPHNLYRDSDFVNVHDATSIEKLVGKDYPELLDGIYLPHYQVQYLSINGYIANLLLQTIFQKGYDDKKHSALKKLKYIFKNFGTNNNSSICTIEDTIIRFFLRNILFFHTVNRNSDIDYIRDAKHDVDTILKSLPVSLSLPLESILKDPNSQFNLVFRELMLSNFDDIPEIVSQLSPIK